MSMTTTMAAVLLPGLAILLVARACRSHLRRQAQHRHATAARTRRSARR